MSYNKYHAKRTELDGITFASRKEADRYAVLKILEKGNLVKNLELQKRFLIVPFQGSLTKEGQSFTKNISGCSSAFVEYSVLDSQQTAIMASRLIIDVLTGKIGQTQMVSWIGPAERLRSEGYQTSEYYNELELKGVTSVSRNITCSKRCRTCGS